MAIVIGGSDKKYVTNGNIYEGIVILEK